MLLCVSIISVAFIAIICVCYYLKNNYKFIINNENNYPNLTIAVIACNRYYYLNQTLKAFFRHLHLYEKEITYNFLYFDQGTVERDEVIMKYKLSNVFLFNPSGYEYSFKVLFSHLYTEYVFLLEEDWVVKKNVEKEIFYPSFLLESLYILSKVNKVYGIVVKEATRFNVQENITVTTKLGNHTLYIGILKYQYAFTNAVTTYRSRNLKEIDYYESEPAVSDIILKKGYKLGFTYKGRKGRKDDLYCQRLMDHIGFKSTRLSMCNIPLY